VPLIIRWPQKIAKGSVSQRLVANYDLLPTITDITGYTEATASDGISFYRDLIQGSADEAHKFVVYSSFYGPTLIANDGWKIRYYLKNDVFELYYLPDDFQKKNNLSEKFPDKLTELKTKMLKACDGNFNNGLYRLSNQIKIPAIHSK